MEIRFKCCNPECGKILRAPEGALGRTARCPKCNTSQVVGGGEQEGEELRIASPDDEAGKSVEAGAILCLGCGERFGAGQVVCPLCGWVYQGGEGAETTGGDGLGAFAVDCIKAITYGTSNFRNIYVLVMYTVGIGTLLWMAQEIFGGLFSQTRAGQVVRFAGAVAALIIVGGFYLRFCLDCLLTTLEADETRTPEEPSFFAGELLMLGVRGLGIAAVYVCPVVTLPLLPLGLLALGCVEDGRSYDLFWALRVAVKRPLYLMTLWAVLIVWIGLAAAATVVLWGGLTEVTRAVAGTSCVGTVVALFIFVAGLAMIVTVDSVLAVAIFRSVGMLGRYCPGLIDMLGERARPLGTAGFLTGGVVASAAVALLFAVPMLALTGPEPAGSSQVEAAGLVKIDEQMKAVLLWRLAVKDAQGMCVSDLNDDKDPEVLVAGGGVLHIIDWSGFEMSRIKVPGGFTNIEAGRINNGQAVILGYRCGGKKVTVIDRGGKRLWWYPCESGVNRAHWCDLDGDGNDEMIIGMDGSGGLCVVDASGGLLWEVPDVVKVWNQLVIGAGEGRTARIIATEASGAVRIFDGTGSKISTIRPLGLYFSGFEAVEIDELGEVQVLGLGMKTDSEDDEIDEDGTGGVLGLGLKNDVENDPIVRKLSAEKASCDFEVVAFDLEGTAEWQTPVTSGSGAWREQQFAAGDLDGDGLSEWVFVSGAGKLAIVSTYGEQIAEIDIWPAHVRTVVVKPKDEEPILVVMQFGIISSYRLEFSDGQESEPATRPIVFIR